MSDPLPESRTITVAAERLAGWVARFAAQHGTPRVEPAEDAWVLVSPDGARAHCRSVVAVTAVDSPDALVAELTRERRLGLLLVRRRAHAVGVALGARLVASSVDRHYVQGRTKAGGWSQQRYARRRANQAAKAWGEAQQDAVELLVGSRVEAVVCGGDRAGVRAVLDDPRLSELLPLVSPQVLPCPDPRRQVLEDFVHTARAVTITLNPQAQTLGGPTVTG